MSSQSLTTFPVNWNWKTAAAILITLPFAITYLFTSLRFFVQLRNKKDGREPPTLPYVIPGLGHALSFAQDSESFLKRLVSRYGYHQPIGIQVGPAKMYFPTDPGQTEILLRSSKELTIKPNLILALANLFGVPRSALKYYEADDSGTMPKPSPGSTTNPEDRIFFHQHHTAHKYLTGHALNLMTERLVESFEFQLMQTDIDKDWIEMPDFWLFFRPLMFEASVEALFGKHMFALNPSLKDDFWEFDRYGLSLLKGLPRWTNPKAYAVRDRVLSAIEKWHKFAKDHVDPTKLTAEDPEWDPYWGAKIFKARHQYMCEMHFMNDQAKAGEDVGFLFASNANAIPAASWLALYTFLDPELLRKARKDVDGSFKSDISANGMRKLDIGTLCSKPLLQSMYAETLRLTAGVVVSRTPRNGPFKLGEWVYPKDSMIVSSVRTGAMNAEVWNTGSPEEPRPLNSFWADRFMIYPNNPKSGPLKEHGSLEEKVTSPEFSLRGLSGTWFPYGGGLTMCPGRHFAKQEMIAAMAVLVAHFDVELLVPDGFVPQVDSSYFPMGVMPIKDKIPFRIRKRS